MTNKKIGGGVVLVIILIGVIWILTKAPVAGPGPVATSTPDLGSYTSAQVASHNSAESCWATVKGQVYDLTSWISRHPGGAQAILSLCGQDGTAAFTAQHGGQARPAAELAGFEIGTLQN